MSNLRIRAPSLQRRAPAVSVAVFCHSIALAVLCLVGVARASTTIDAVNRYAYGANFGWIDWRGDTNTGAVIGQYFCSGNIYSANAGWINLGSGSPTNGMQYQNLSAADFGVNVDSQGNLRGYAYGADIGWVNFETNGDPQVSLLTGNLSGYVWSANCGWISLSNAEAYVQTDILPPTITTGSLLPEAVANSGYNETLMPSGGHPDMWSVTSGSLPPGLGLSTGGVLSGTPTTPGTYTFTVRVTSNGESTTKSFTLIVTLPTTIDAGNRYAYGANFGWMDWRGNSNNGAVLGQYVCSGYIYSANAGWINLGGGLPANGIQYQNDSAADFGVNADSQGNLRGYAYGADIGWINFEETGAPQLSLRTGNLSGYVWSANCGWISLSNAVAYVQTDTLWPGPLDPDGSGLPTAWS